MNTKLIHLLLASMFVISLVSSAYSFYVSSMLNNSVNSLDSSALSQDIINSNDIEKLRAFAIFSANHSEQAIHSQADTYEINAYILILLSSLSMFVVFLLFYQMFSHRLSKGKELFLSKY